MNPWITPASLGLLITVAGYILRLELRNNNSALIAAQEKQSAAAILRAALSDERTLQTSNRITIVENNYKSISDRLDQFALRLNSLELTFTKVSDQVTGSIALLTQIVETQAKQIEELKEWKKGIQSKLPPPHQNCPLQ